ncbi:MAG TPA: hypothetical protein VHA09_02870 [Nitrososphaera sp.]|nr:hypothetical protein [Nitrososphaera sp.]
MVIRLPEWLYRGNTTHLNNNSSGDITALRAHYSISRSDKCIARYLEKRTKIENPCIRRSIAYSDE